MNSLETDPEHTEIPLKIFKLSKTYFKLLDLHHHNKNALDSFTISGDKGSVLVLLGHNGAGKSTCVKMLTGLSGPSTGDALIYGKSIVNNMSEVREMMGVCLQDNILFDEMTGYQHMRLFCILKGVRKFKQHIREKLDQVGMWKFRNQRAKTYSGGMKRRLSVAISTIGDPKIIFMDEPTSGMDPAARRKIWDLLSTLKKDRIIVLTTHSMEGV